MNNQYKICTYMYVYMKAAGNSHQNVFKGIISHNYMIKISLDKQIGIHTFRYCQNMQ